MGGCAKKMAEVEISPQHFQRKVQQMSSLRVKSKQLPVKQKAEPSNKMSWTEIIEINRNINPSTEQQAPIDTEMQEYLQSTKATIIRKRRRDSKTHINPHMTVNSQPSVTSKTATMDQLNSKLDQEEIEQMFEMSTCKTKQKDCIPSSLDDKLRNGEPPRKKRRSYHTTEFENNDKENKDIQGQKTNSSIKKKISGDSRSASALNDPPQMTFPSKENIYDLVQENDVIEGTEGQNEDYSYISLRNRVTNVYYLLPKAQAGPLIVSKLDYDRYAV